MVIDWNNERYRTRDRLLEYDGAIMPLIPHSAGLASVYPWEDATRTVLSNEIYKIAQAYGFTGSEAALWEGFAGGHIVRVTTSTFPEIGVANNLYLDIETDILYYFKVFNQAINQAAVEEMGGFIVGEPTNEATSVYLPVRALLIEDTILNCGSAAEYID